MATIHQFVPRAKAPLEAVTPVRVNTQPAEIIDVSDLSYLRLLNLQEEPMFATLVTFLLGLNEKFKYLCGTPEHNYLIDGIRYELSYDDEKNTQMLEIHGPSPDESKAMRYVQVVVSQLDEISPVGSPYTAKMCLDKMNDLVTALKMRLPTDFSTKTPAHVVVPFDLVQYLLAYEDCKVVNYFMASNPPPIFNKSPFINLQSMKDHKQYRVSVNFNALSLIYDREQRPF